MDFQSFFIVSNKEFHLRYFLRNSKRFAYFHDYEFYRQTLSFFSFSFSISKYSRSLFTIYLSILSSFRNLKFAINFEKDIKIRKKAVLWLKIYAEELKDSERKDVFAVHRGKTYPWGAINKIEFLRTRLSASIKRNCTFSSNARFLDF